MRWAKSATLATTLTASHVIRASPAAALPLAVGEDFSHMLGELGLARRHPATLTATCPSPFDHHVQTLALVPKHFPAPDAPDYDLAVGEVVRDLNGMDESAFLARVGEGVVSAIGSSKLSKKHSRKLTCSANRPVEERHGNPKLLVSGIFLSSSIRA